MVTTTGLLRWGIRPSLLEYLEEAEARFEVSGGAIAELGTGVAFPIESVPSGPQSGDVIQAAGEVIIWAYGVRMIWLAQPSIAIGETRAELQVTRWAGRDARLTIATAPATPRRIPEGWEWTDAVLAETGVEVFGSRYIAGAELAPFRLERDPAV